MTAALDLSAANNATWTHGPIALLDAAEAPLALPAGTKIRMQLRETADSVNVALDLSIGRGLVMVDIEAAEIAIEVSAAEMGRLAAGTYAYDIIVEQPSGRVHRPVAGVVTIDQGVTR